MLLKSEMKTYIQLVVLMLFVAACKSTDPAVSDATANSTRNLIADGNYRMSFYWASPRVTNEFTQLSAANLLPIDSRSGRINLTGTENYIRVKGDSVQLYLPYFGTRQLSMNPAETSGSILYEGLLEDYTVDYDETKRRSSIRFSVKEDSEKFDISIQVAGNTNVTANVYSTHRTSISYTGEIAPIAE